LQSISVTSSPPMSTEPGRTSIHVTSAFHSLTLHQRDTYNITVWSWLLGDRYVSALGTPRGWSYSNSAKIGRLSFRLTRDWSERRDACPVVSTGSGRSPH